jgi:predicted amidohydrolase
VRIGLAQQDAVLGDVDANLERAEHAVATAVREGAELVVFPELSLTGYSIGQLDDDVSIRADDPRLAKLSRAASDAGVLVGFVDTGPHGPHTYNSVAYYEAGELVHLHRKLYLPQYHHFEERNYFTPGPGLRAFSTANEVRMAVLLCNDAWQPPLAFIATQDGAQVLLVPASSAQSVFPERYDAREYWQVITSFYGRMFQLFVVFVNRVGTEEGLRFWGGSHVVDPWGNLVAEAVQGEEQILVVDIDLADVRRRRREVPLVKEARLGLIQREIARLVEEGGDL